MNQEVIGLMEKSGKLFEEGNLLECENCIDRILCLEPSNGLALYMLGTLYSMSGKNGLAIPYLGLSASVLRKGPPDARMGCLHNLSVALRQEGHTDAAQQAAWEALEIDEDCAEAWNNLASNHINNGNPQEGEKYARRAVELDPTMAEGWNNLAHILMEQGKWAEGFDAYKWRLQTSNYLKSKRNFGDAKEWDGEKTGTLVIHGEQGLGDEIMFCSLVEEAFPKADRVIVEVNHKIAKLMRRSLPCDVVTTQEEAREEAGKIDAYIPMANLAALYRRDQQSFDKQKPYLKADPERVHYWRKKLEELGQGPYVVLAWRGGTKKTHEDVRNPPLDLFKKMIDETNAKFVSIQYTPEAPEIARSWGIPHWKLAANDMDEQAALIEACDLTVSVAQTALHVAGALGKRAIGIIGSRPAWVFGLSGEKMSWYKSVKLMRQKGDDWATLMEEVSHEISPRELMQAAE